MRPGRLAAAVLCSLLVLSVAPAAAQDPSPSSSASAQATPAGMPNPTASAPPATLRPEGRWQVTSYDPTGSDTTQPLRGSMLTVLFLPDGRLEGSTACGDYQGGYFVDAEALSIGIVAAGTEPCGQRRVEEEAAFTRALGAAASWVATAEGGLLILDAEGRPRVSLAHEGAPAIHGEWSVTGYANPNGRLLDPLAAPAPVLSFDPGGRVMGSSGCRLLEGPYSLEADRILIGPLDTTGLPCEGASRRQERLFRAALEGTILWQVDGDRLRLLDGVGGVLVEAASAADAADAGGGEL